MLSTPTHVCISQINPHTHTRTHVRPIQSLIAQSYKFISFAVGAFSSRSKVWANGAPRRTAHSLLRLSDVQHDNHIYTYWNCAGAVVVRCVRLLSCRFYRTHIIREIIAERFVVIEIIEKSIRSRFNRVGHRVKPVADRVPRSWSIWCPFLWAATSEWCEPGEQTTYSFAPAQLTFAPSGVSVTNVRVYVKPDR